MVAHHVLPKAGALEVTLTCISPGHNTPESFSCASYQSSQAEVGCNHQRTAQAQLSC